MPVTLPPDAAADVRSGVRAARRAQANDDVRTPQQQLRELLLAPMSVSTMEVVFAMDRRSITRRIAGVRPVAVGARGHPEYGFRDVAPYLVESVVDVGEIITNMDPSDLPPRLQDAFWSAMNRRRAFLEDAGQLWRDDAVAAVFADSCKMIKRRLTLLPVVIGQKYKLPPEALEFVEAAARDMLEKIHADLVEGGREGKHKSFRAEIEEQEATMRGADVAAAAGDMDRGDGDD